MLGALFGKVRGNHILYLHNLIKDTVDNLVCEGSSFLVMYDITIGYT